MIKYLWEMIKGYFKSREPPKPIELDENISLEDIKKDLDDAALDDLQSSITFMISKQGAIDLNISWEESDSITAKNLALLMHVIHSGGFENHCGGLLINIANTQPENANFIRECIAEWNAKKREDPLIKPSEVFQFGTINQE